MDTGIHRKIGFSLFRITWISVHLRLNSNFDGVRGLMKFYRYALFTVLIVVVAAVLFIKPTNSPASVLSILVGVSSGAGSGNVL